MGEGNEGKRSKLEMADTNTDTDTSIFVGFSFLFFFYGKREEDVRNKLKGKRIRIFLGIA